MHQEDKFPKRKTIGPRSIGWLDRRFTDGLMNGSEILTRSVADRLEGISDQKVGIVPWELYLGIVPGYTVPK
jgi:hypothetical protein